MTARLHAVVRGLRKARLSRVREILAGSAAAMLVLCPPLLASPLAQEAAAAAETPKTLSAGGWMFMLISLTFVWILTLWCFKRVLGESKTHVPPQEGFTGFVGRGP